MDVPIICLYISDPNHLVPVILLSITSPKQLQFISKYVYSTSRSARARLEAGAMGLADAAQRRCRYGDQYEGQIRSRTRLPIFHSERSRGIYFAYFGGDNKFA